MQCILYGGAGGNATHDYSYHYKSVLLFMGGNVNKLNTTQAANNNLLRSIDGHSFEARLI